MDNKKGKILIVEDDKIDRMAFERFAKKKKLPYDYIVVESVKEAKQVLKQEKFDAVLLDYMLGDGTAFDLFDKVKGSPFIIITGTGDEEIAVQAMKSGAYDYLTKDSEGHYLKTVPVTIENAIKRKHAEEELIKYREHLEELVQKRTAELTKVNVQLQQEIKERKLTEKKLQQSYNTLGKSMESAIYTIARIIEMRDPYTAGHQQRVANLSCAISIEMGLSEEQISAIHLAATIHDIGKIYIPTEILNKRGEWTEFEFNLTKLHPQTGFDILKTIEFPWPIAQIVLQHHERIDGSGYPQGLSGDKILLEAKILGVADVVEAMASHRPYRSAMGKKRALEEISQKKGVLYDPHVVDACLKLFNKKGFEFNQKKKKELLRPQKRSGNT